VTLDLPHRLVGQVPVNLEHDARIHVRVKRLAQVGGARRGRDDERRRAAHPRQTLVRLGDALGESMPSMSCQSVGSLALRRVAWALAKLRPGLSLP